MKVSVRLPDGDVVFLDRYATTAELDEALRLHLAL